MDPESMDVESGIHKVESGIQDSLGLPYGENAINKKGAKTFRCGATFPVKVE